MAESQTHQAVTDFSAAMTSGQTFQLSGRPARHTVLFFYPKDNTPGCTTENMAFRDLPMPVCPITWGELPGRSGQLMVQGAAR